MLLLDSGEPFTFLLLLWKERKGNKFRIIFVLILLDVYLDNHLYRIS